MWPYRILSTCNKGCFWRLLDRFRKAHLTPSRRYRGIFCYIRSDHVFDICAPVPNITEHIEDITRPRVDMNFIFEWSTRYLTSERSERVRYRVDHEKIKFISISGHVMFCLLYKHQWNTKPFYFNIFNGLKVERVVTKHGRSTWMKTKFIW